MAGSVAGGVGAAGAAVTTFVFEGETNAQLGFNSTVSGNNVTVSADSDEKVGATAAAAALGGVAGADSVVAVLSSITTTATVNDNANLDLAGKLTISATDKPDFALTAGSVSGGGNAAGAAVDLLIFRNTVAAGIKDNATINAGSIDIDATADRKLDVYSASGSGAGVAVSGSVVVISVGATVSTGETAEALSSENGNTQSSITASIDEALGNAELDSSMVSVDKYFSDDTLSDKISAFIGKNGEVDANGNISVDANEKTTANAISGTVAAGGTAVGGSVLVGTFNATTESYVDSLVSSDANVGISAKNEWTTNVAISAKDADGNVMASVAITGAPFKANRATEYSGRLFGEDAGMTVSLSEEWESAHVGTW
jgi:hypothetical protein